MKQCNKYVKPALATSTLRKTTVTAGTLGTHTVIQQKNKSQFHIYIYIHISHSKTNIYSPPTHHQPPPKKMGIPPPQKRNPYLFFHIGCFRK